MTNGCSLRSTQDLRPSERRFVAAMQGLGYGRFESLRIRDAELILDPWPTTVRSIKFGNASPNKQHSRCVEFELKRQTAQLFEFVRSADSGEIRILEIRGGLPFAMEFANNCIR